MPANSIVVEQVTRQVQRVNARMAKIKHKVLIMSGKGGVGKSFVSSNLAQAFALKDYAVGILDADINGPAIPRMMGIPSDHLKISPEGAIPAEGPLKIKVMSMDLLLSGKDTPVIWDGPAQSEFVWRGALEFLGSIPFDPRIAECSDSGLPLLIEFKNTQAGKSIIQIADKVEAILNKS